MPDWNFSDEELKRYLEDPSRRKPGGRAASGAGGGLGGGSGSGGSGGGLGGGSGSGGSGSGPGLSGGPSGGGGGGGNTPPPGNTLWARFQDRFSSREMAVAVAAVGTIAIVGLLSVLTIGFWMYSMRDELPPLTEIENPDFQLATIAYTADGKELARYASQNRAWITYQDIAPVLVRGLVATEDKRFYDHWGMDLFRTVSAVGQTILGKFGLPFDKQGGSTISQQLARNLYNTRIGRVQTVERKLKEMVTAVQMEQRYTKQEIIEMYLNTVEFGYNIYGVETAAQTFFRKSAADVDVSEAAVLIGMLKGTSIYNPYRYPERAKNRRNTVLSLMAEQGVIDEVQADSLYGKPVEAFNSSYAITSSIAPYFAQHVKEWLDRWGRENGYNVNEDGLVVYTTLDSRMQQLAHDALQKQTDCLQKVVDFQWSRSNSGVWSIESCDYNNAPDHTPFQYYWDSQPEYLNQMIRETARFRTARSRGEDGTALLASLRNDSAFLDSLKAVKSRLEAGMLSMNPHTGEVKAWIGGRDLATDWFDHVDKAARQPGSTFKPFLYTAAIDNGWSPYYQLLDDSVNYVAPDGQRWNPGNSDSPMTGQMYTLREGLARSMNTISARLILEVGAPQVAFIARVMGITSPLAEVPSLALGVSDVTLYEMVSAYSTLANGGFRIEPVVVTRIEDAQQNVLYESLQSPRQALSPETANTVVDMMRGVITSGTGRRMRSQFGMGEYDLAGKTGTTQNSADGWFIAMHPDLVTGAWVGFNDRRVTFRSSYWGQGAHNALLVVGDYHQRLSRAGEGLLPKDSRFPPAPFLGTDEVNQQDDRDDRGRGRVGW